MPGTKWITGDVITFARMNQKTLIVQGAEPAIMYAGMLWLDTDDNLLSQRAAANNAWHTITKEELAYTITGLWTFNRGAAAPFAVDAASLKVTNLNADKVDGVNIPGTIAQILSDHNKAAHDALNIDADTVDGKDTGLNDDEILVLPASAQGEILHRGAAAWESGELKFGAIQISSSWTGADWLGSIDNRIYVAILAPAYVFKVQIKDDGGTWRDVYTADGNIMQTTVINRWYVINIAGSLANLRFYRAGGGTLNFAYYELEAS